MVQIERGDAQEFVRQINSLLGALSRALEQVAFGDRTFETAAVEEAYLSLQKVSFQFKSQCGRLQSQKQFDFAISNLRENLETFTRQVNFGLLREIRVRVPRLTQRARLGFLHPAISDSTSLTPPAIVHLLDESLQAALSEAPFRIEELVEHELSDVDLQQVRKSIPVQRVAPAQFEISNGVLKVRAQAKTPKANAASVASQSLEVLIQQGLEIEDAIRTGNYDRRFLEKMRQLNDSLSTEENIIKLGLESMTCGAMAKSMAGELSDALLAQLDGFTAGLAMYVAQFEEWQTFVQNAAEAAVDENSSGELRDFANALLKEFSDFKEVIDPQVPITIKFLSDLLSDPKKTSKRSIFAFVRTIENLIIESFSFLIATVQLTAEKTREKVAEKGSTYLVRALVSVGLISAAGMMPISAQIKGMEWIQGAYHVVKEQVAPKITSF